MTEHGQMMDILNSGSQSELHVTMRSDRQQAELLARLNALIAALGRVDARVETTPDPDEIMATLGAELKRLQLDCFMALLEPDGRALVFRYWSPEAETVINLENFLGVKLRGARLLRQRYFIFQEVIQRHHPIFFGDWTAAISQVAPDAPGALIEQALQMANAPMDARVAFFPLRVADRVLGILGVWGDDLSESDLAPLSVFVTQVAITVENARLIEQVRLARERLRLLVRRVVSAQEDERQRVSRELHDEAGQALTALKISLELIQADLPAELLPFRQRMGEATVLVDRTLEQIHLLVQNLRPPILDAIGLNAAMESYCNDFARRTRLPVAYGGTDVTLPGAVSISFYRLLQEALTNVAKHAHPVTCR